MLFGMRALRIGRILGIDIEIHASWVIVFLLVFVQLAFGIFPQPSTAAELLANLVVGFATTLTFFGSVLAHELAHSLVGRAFGVRIDRITLFIFGGVAQMRGEATDPKSEFLMAAAGPASSIGLALAFGVLFIGGLLAGAPQVLTIALEALATVNLGLALFNLVPGFPLDGGRLFRATLWLLLGDMGKATRIASRAGQLVAVLLMAYGGVRLLLDKDPGGAWLALIGLFLYNAATGSYQQLAIDRALAGVRVDQIMTRDLVVAPARLPVSGLVDEYFLRFRHGRFPVEEDGAIVGTVTLNDVRGIPQDEWVSRSAGQLARPLRPEDLIAPDEPALSALVRMAQSGAGQLLVSEGGHIVGIVTKTDVMEAVSIRSELARR